MLLKVINLLMFALMILMNYLANALPINGKTTGQLSAEYPNLFVPAGVTFSIWGVIYLMLLVFVVMQFFETNKEITQAIGWAFAITCLFNALWIVAWHYQLLPLSLAIMLGLLATLIIVGFRLQPFSLGLVKATFGIYIGWICIATIANFTALLVNYGWSGWGLSEVAWTIMLIAVGTIILSAAIIKMSNPFIGIAAMWAFLGIVLKRQVDYQSIAVAAIVVMAIVGTVTIISLLKGGSAFKV